MKFTQKAVRRWFAAALALLLTFTLALPAMAATAEAGDDYTITIKNNEGLPKMENGQFKAYQLFTGTPNKEENPEGGWKKPNDWKGENWDNYTLADIKWGKGVKAEELVKALMALSAEASDEDMKNWPEFFTDVDTNVFSNIAEFKPGSTDLVDGTLEPAAAKLAYVLQSHNTNAFLQAFSKFVVEGNKDGKGPTGPYISETYTASTLTSGTEAKDDVSTIDLSGEGDGKGPGYYLIVDDEKHTSEEQTDGVTSEYILAVLGSQDIQLKASVPTVDKTIENPGESGNSKGDAVGISDTVTFKLTGTLPKNFLDYDSYFYKFTDTLSKGLAYDDIDMVTVTLPAAREGEEPTTYTISFVADPEAETEAAKGYTVTEPKDPSEEDGSTTLEVTFLDLKQLEGTKYPSEESARPERIPWDTVSFENMPKVEISITYFATVTDDVVIGSTGNPNEVYLTYSNDPNSNEQGKTHKEKVYVYAFGLDLTKKASDTGAGLAGASFVLTKKDAEGKTLYAKFAEDSTSETTPKAKKLVQWDDESTYNASESKDDDYYLTSGEDGKLPNAEGLDEGTYTLIETVTPAGYNTMDPFTFTIKAEINTAGQLTKVTYTHDGKSKEYSATGSEEITGVFKSGLLPDDLINQKAPFLPFTGGMGSTLIYLAGALLIAGAAVTVAVVVRKRSKTHA